MYLFFDTETTGLPRNWKAPVSDVSNWPRLVQLAYICYNKDGEKIAEGDFIVKPVGFSIPHDASRIHGITTERALREGQDLLRVLQDFQNMVEQAQYMVAHNISFDEKIIGAEFIRAGLTDVVASRKKICTMDKATSYCALPGMYGYKWPKLSELHYKLFGVGFEEAHNAAVDINITAKCFWEMKKRGII